VFNVTKVISNSTADAVGECYTTLFNVFTFTKMRAALFNDGVGVMTAFLQNLIGNILNFNTIYTNILNANEAGKMSDVYFFMGRLTYLIIYFDPIVELGLFNVPSGVQSFVPDVSSMLLENKYHKLKQINNKYEWKGSGEKANPMTIIIDLPTSFFSSSIAKNAQNSSICMGNLSQFNQTANQI
jgi:hypothetical protein